MKRRNTERAGLTLVEVLIALAILGIGLFVLIATASKCLAVARQAKNYEKARHLLGRVELEEPLDPEEIEEGTDSGGFEGEDSDYRWVREIRLIGEEEDGLYEITTRVTWSERGKQAFEDVVTYLYVPEEKRGGVFERAAP
jgi:prepilin-type N-terminal cleavage/methylation domain-containing protein